MYAPDFLGVALSGNILPPYWTISTNVWLQAYGRLFLFIGRNLPLLQASS